MSTEEYSERTDDKGRKPEHHSNGLTHQYAHESAPPRRHQSHPAAHRASGGIDYNAMEPEYTRMGLYLVKPTDNWNTIVSMSLRAQHKEDELHNPAARQAERERIELATEKWKKSGDPNAHVEHAAFQVARSMILNMRSEPDAQTASRPSEQPVQNVARPGEPQKPVLPVVSVSGREVATVPKPAEITSTPLPPIRVEHPQAQTQPATPSDGRFVPPHFTAERYTDPHATDVAHDLNVSRHPIVSKGYGSDYGAMGLLLVDQKHDTWRSIARRTLAYQNKESEIGNVQAENHEIARLMWNAEQFKVSGLVDPSKRVAQPRVIPLSDVGLIPYWDKSIGPDPKHLWRAPDAAQPGELYHAGYGDRVTALPGSRVIASPGSDVNFMTGSTGFVMRGAHAEAAAGTVILTNGADIERAPGAFVRKVSVQGDQQ